MATHNGTGVYDVEEKHVYDSEKAQLEGAHGHGVHNGHTANPRFPGKQNEYAIEVAPAGGGAGVRDAVFGDMEGKGPNYRAVSFRSHCHG